MEEIRQRSDCSELLWSHYTKNDITLQPRVNFGKPRDYSNTGYKGHCCKGQSDLKNTFVVPVIKINETYFRLYGKSHMRQNLKLR